MVHSLQAAGSLVCVSLVLLAAAAARTFAKGFWQVLVVGVLVLVLVL
jgi:ABC-type Mn2+/Zn2+ transport system permease subunit